MSLNLLSIAGKLPFLPLPPLLPFSFFLFFLALSFSLGVYLVTGSTLVSRLFPGGVVFPWLRLGFLGPRGSCQYDAGR